MYLAKQFRPFELLAFTCWEYLRSFKIKRWMLAMERHVVLFAASWLEWGPAGTGAVTIWQPWGYTHEDERGSHGPWGYFWTGASDFLLNLKSSMPSLFKLLFVRAHIVSWTFIPRFVNFLSYLFYILPKTLDRRRTSFYSKHSVLFLKNE